MGFFTIDFVSAMLLLPARPHRLKGHSWVAVEAMNAHLYLSRVKGRLKLGQGSPEDGSSIARSSLPEAPLEGASRVP